MVYKYIYSARAERARVTKYLWRAVVVQFQKNPFSASVFAFGMQFSMCKATILRRCHHLPAFFVVLSANAFDGFFCFSFLSGFGADRVGDLCFARPGGLQLGGTVRGEL